MGEILWGLATNSLTQTWTYGIATLGVFISLRVLRFPDLTVDGSFTLGAACTSLALSLGFPPIAAFPLAAAAGSLAGTFTALIHTRLGLSKLLSGILSLMILYSVNFRVMGLRSNIGFPEEYSLLSAFHFPVNLLGSHTWSLLLLIALGVVAFLLVSPAGLYLRATGENEDLVRGLGVPTDRLKVVGLALANSLVAVAGAAVAQNQGFADLNMGIGMIIITIAALILGEELLKRFGSHMTVPVLILAAPLGTFLYYLVVLGAFRFSLSFTDSWLRFHPTDLRMLTALIVVAAAWFRRRTSAERATFDL